MDRGISSQNGQKQSPENPWVMSKRVVSAVRRMQFQKQPSSVGELFRFARFCDITSPDHRRIIQLSHLNIKQRLSASPPAGSQAQSHVRPHFFFYLLHRINGFYTPVILISKEAHSTKERDGAEWSSSTTYNGLKTGYCSVLCPCCSLIKACHRYLIPTP